MSGHIYARLTQMDCRAEEDCWRCQCSCGYTTTIKKPQAWHACDTRPKLKTKSKTPGLAAKAANFATSAAKHVAAGMPKATEAQIAERFAICQTCEHYDGKACKQCGCPVVREKKFFSKLSWANESCPVGKWGPASS